MRRVELFVRIEDEEDGLCLAHGRRCHEGLGRILKLPKLQIEGLGFMRRLSLKSTLFGVDPKNQTKKARKLLKLAGLKTMLKGGLEPPRQ